MSATIHPLHPFQHNGSRPAWFYSLITGVLGFALNHVSVPVFGGTEIVLGGAATLLATYWLGPWWGLLATVIGFSYTWLAWGHPWGLVCYTLEAVVVGWLRHRRHWTTLRGSLFYWAAIGTPLALLAIVSPGDIPFPYNWAIALKYPVNSLLMTMLLLPVLYSRRFRQWAGLSLEQDADTPLQIVLFRRLGVIIALSIGTLGLFVGQKFDRSLRAMTNNQLVGDGREVALDLQVHLDRHQRVLQLIASGGPEIIAPDSGEAGLERVHRNYPGFLTLLAADQAGRITAASPALNSEGQRIGGSGLSVADRDYFRLPMATGRPFVSNVFKGRGFGGDLIVAMSSPVADAGGRRVGVVEGSLNLARLIEDVAQPDQFSNRTVVIVDREHRVVASRGELHRQALHDFSHENVYLAAQEAAEETFVFDLRLEGRNERFVGSRQVVPGFGWEVYLAEPVWRSQRVIAGYYLTTTLAAAAALGLALLLARGTAAEITQPLKQLVIAMRRIARHEEPPGELETAHGSRELTALSRDLHGVTLALSQTNRELAGAIHERDRSHQQLRQVLLHLEEKVRERTVQLDEARRTAESANAAKSEFLASMSHELRTPLNVILGMSELVLERGLGPLTDRQAEGLQSINESGSHLLSLINDILDLSKIEAGMLELDFQPTDVSDLCTASVRFVTESARKKHLTLRTDIRTPAASILADDRRLKQILVNLLANAVKFTPAGGEVGLDVRASADGAAIRFEVWDTGIGIAREHFGKIFQPFQQIDSSLSRQYAGTGLGLSLVRRMTELHGGTVELDSTVGRGSRFSIVLPLRRAADPASPAGDALPAGESLPPLPPRVRILIAEDNESNLMVYRGYFSSRGCDLCLAANGREAIERAVAERPDIILMDVHMPVMDGLEATRRLRADPRTEHIPIIVITALAMNEDRISCLEAGASAYLSKPINLRELGRLLSRFAPRPGRPAALTSAP